MQYFFGDLENSEGPRARTNDQRANRHNNIKRATELLILFVQNIIKLNDQFANVFEII